MSHGSKQTFEIVGERQIVAGKAIEPPRQGFRFGRIFHGIPPFRPTDSSLQALGATMTAMPVRPDSAIPAGYTYFGQFVDHDITRDETAGRPEEAVPLVDDFGADAIRQGRSPSLDLDSIYGGPGQPEQPILAPDGVTLRLGDTTPVGSFPTPSEQVFPGRDLPRLGAAAGADFGKATIGDDRNDENLIIAQLHLAFLKFHNRVAAHLAEENVASAPVSPPVMFAQTRELVTRHYQWLVLNDFVRRIVSKEVFKSVLGTEDLKGVTELRLNPLVFRVSGPQTPPMPLEFSAAAYRFGHSMVRDVYTWNRFFKRGTTFNLFFAFTHLSGGIGRPPGTPGTGPAAGLPTFPSNWIADWRRMFDMERVAGFPAFRRGTDEDGGEIPLNFAKQLDPQLASALGNLPFGGGNLAARNLIRGARNGLPSGQDVAAAIVAAGDPSAAALTPEKIVASLDDATRTVVREHEFDIKTPLWFYILKEAEVIGLGERLGPVGSRIVLETFVALIRASMTSIFNADYTKAQTLKLFSPEHDSTLRTPGGEPVWTLAHMLALVDDVNPLGDPLPLVADATPLAPVVEPVPAPVG